MKQSNLKKRLEARVNEWENIIKGDKVTEKKKGTWVFTDEEVGLVDEPFVLGTGEIIDSLVDGRKNFKVLISHSPIPMETTVLEKIKTPITYEHIDELEEYVFLGMESEEGWYKEQHSGMVGWLCPATLKYFKTYPDEIHVKIE